MQTDQARWHYVTEFLRAKPLASCMPLWPTHLRSRQRRHIIRAMRQSCSQALQDYASSPYGIKQRQELEAALDSWSRADPMRPLERPDLPCAIPSKTIHLAASAGSAAASAGRCVPADRIRRQAFS